MKASSNNRDQARRLHEQIVAAMNKQGQCLHPEAPVNCSGSTVAAHSVQNALIKQIADNAGKVYTPQVTLFSPEAAFSVTKVPARRASIFHGFCAHHDTELFRKIENDDFKYTAEDALLLAFRSVSKELFDKQGVVQFDISDVVSKFSIDPHAMLLYEVLNQVKQRESYDLRDISVLHGKMGQSILKKKYDQTRFYAIEFDRVPDILCSGTISLAFDLFGNQIQDLTKTGKLDVLTYSLLPFKDGKGGVIIFAWYGTSPVNTAFIRSLNSLSDDAIPDTIARFVLQHSENYFAAPKWRNGFSTSQKSRLDDLLMRTASSGPYPLTDRNGVDFPLVDWKVVGKPKTNLKL